MSICVVVLNERTAADQLNVQLREAGTPLVSSQLVRPATNKTENTEPSKKEADKKSTATSIDLQPVEINTVEILTPKLARQKHQRIMAFWLLPFGLVGGVLTTKITGLDTFARFGTVGEPLVGGLVGLISGWIGSYASAASVKPENAEDVRLMRKRNQEGRWLLVLETPMGIDLNWKVVQQFKPIAVTRLSDL